MPTDELLDDHDMDRALRDLLPPMPGSHAWERVRRDELLAFIESGAAIGVVPPVAGDVELHSRQDGTGRRSPRRPWVPVGAAAAGVALVAGLVVAPRWQGAEAPAEQPPGETVTSPEEPSGSTITSPDMPTASSTVPSLPAPGALRPDRYPVVGDSYPFAAEATAMYGNQLAWSNGEQASVTVARVDGGVITSGIGIAVIAELSDDPVPLSTVETITVAGLEMTRYVEGGTPPIETVVLAGAPALAASGADVVGFLEAAGGFPVWGARIDADGSVAFALGELPEGYEVIVPPTRLPLGAISAQTRAPDGDDGDGIGVEVSVLNGLSGHWPGSMRKVDVNGAEAWLNVRERGASVVWQVSATTWAQIGGAATADEALAFARSLTFVDEATWRDRYHVEEPDFLTREQELAPPPTTLPEPTELIVGRYTWDPSAAAQTPIACGERPYIGDTVAEPVVAAAPEPALVAFLAGPMADVLLKLGYEELRIGESDHYRYEHRNNVGQLVTVIFVDPVEGGWAATRWQASPC